MPIGPGHCLGRDAAEDHRSEGNPHWVNVRCRRSARLAGKEADGVPFLNPNCQDEGVLTARYVYPCILEAEYEGGFFVRFPDLPEALTGGSDREDALAMAKDCLVSALSLYVRNGEDVPVPSPIQDRQVPITLPPVIAAKLDLCMQPSDNSASVRLTWMHG